MTAFRIKIISDNICPFCHLGRARLDRAIAQFRETSPADTFDISWHAYHLDPNAPTTSEPVLEMVARKYGAARTAAMQQRLRQAGASEGINFTFAGRTGSTRDSHRLIQLGRQRNAEDSVVREIMRMYFEEEGDITAEEDLVGAAERAGLDADEARGWLREGKGGKEVDREVAEAYAMGVTGVPHFVINDRFEVHGAEDVPVFLEQFRRAKEADAAA
ncbi:hypothetical protein ACRE_008790 [Hapsidospora chrysogenum ATCC 11550]|uniref:DSBA-like thioredoxin domain-containing protein n=1 Tax=Hapsidospora chrysogenum (strain ATCC 11550 / CBS 779.69 / DSM 880 / IAM 14645 / JCM 23072 / IMI 49137) TaxID=857340 RepID=A0A086TFW9_HAPC1|nr:hypothetical protein ACRE_008790 [Hapsidospora chrysogenum ATCC 11550]